MSRNLKPRSRAWKRPGKGNCVVPVDSIDGPIVKLKNGEVRKLYSIHDAREVKNKVVEILFLGDMLVAFGEFLRNNQPMLGSCWCEEWWIECIRNSDKYQSLKEAVAVDDDVVVSQQDEFSESEDDVSEDKEADEK